MRDWLIHRLGGFTAAEFEANRAAFDQLVSDMKKRGKFGAILEGSVLNAHVAGDLLAAPNSTIIGGYFEPPAKVA